MIERLSAGLPPSGLKITAHDVKSHPYKFNPDRNRFRSSGVDMAVMSATYVFMPERLAFLVAVIALGGVE